MPDHGLYIIFQMDWKRYVIALAKYLPSLLRPKVHPEISGYTVTMAPKYYERDVLSLLLLWFIVNVLMMFSTPNVSYPIKQS